MKAKEIELIEGLINEQHEELLDKWQNKTITVGDAVSVKFEKLKEAKEIIANYKQKIIEQPSEEKIQKLIDKKLKESNLLQHERHRKTKIIVEMKMREIYLFGFNECLNNN